MSKEIRNKIKKLEYLVPDKDIDKIDIGNLLAVTGTVNAKMRVAT